MAMLNPFRLRPLPPPEGWKPVMSGARPESQEKISTPRFLPKRPNPFRSHSRNSSANSLQLPNSGLEVNHGIEYTTVSQNITSRPGKRVDTVGRCLICSRQSANTIDGVDFCVDCFKVDKHWAYPAPPLRCSVCFVAVRQRNDDTQSSFNNPFKNRNSSKESISKAKESGTITCSRCQNRFPVKINHPSSRAEPRSEGTRARSASDGNPFRTQNIIENNHQRLAIDLSTKQCLSCYEVQPIKNFSKQPVSKCCQHSIRVCRACQEKNVLFSIWTNLRTPVKCIHPGCEIRLMLDEIRNVSKKETFASYERLLRSKATDSRRCGSPSSRTQGLSIQIPPSLGLDVPSSPYESVPSTPSSIQATPVSAYNHNSNISPISTQGTFSSSSSGSLPVISPVPQSPSARRNTPNRPNIRSFPPSAYKHRAFPDASTSSISVTSESLVAAPAPSEYAQHLRAQSSASTLSFAVEEGTPEMGSRLHKKKSSYDWAVGVLRSIKTKGSTSDLKSAAKGSTITESSKSPVKGAKEKNKKPGNPFTKPANPEKVDSKSNNTLASSKVDNNLETALLGNKYASSTSSNKIMPKKKQSFDRAPNGIKVVKPRLDPSSNSSKSKTPLAVLEGARNEPREPSIPKKSPFRKRLIKETSGDTSSNNKAKDLRGTSTEGSNSEADTGGTSGPRKRRIFGRGPPKRPLSRNDKITLAKTPKVDEDSAGSAIVAPHAPNTATRIDASIFPRQNKTLRSNDVSPVQVTEKISIAPDTSNGCDIPSNATLLETDFASVTLELSRPRPNYEWAFNDIASEKELLKNPWDEENVMDDDSSSYHSAVDYRTGMVSSSLSSGESSAGYSTSSIGVNTGSPAIQTPNTSISSYGLVKSARPLSDKKGKGKAKVEEQVEKEVVSVLQLSKSTSPSSTIDLRNFFALNETAHEGELKRLDEGKGRAIDRNEAKEVVISTGTEVVPIEKEALDLIDLKQSVEKEVFVPLKHYIATAQAGPTRNFSTPDRREITLLEAEVAELADNTASKMPALTPKKAERATEITLGQENSAIEPRPSVSPITVLNSISSGTWSFLSYISGTSTVAPENTVKESSEPTPAAVAPTTTAETSDVSASSLVEPNPALADIVAFIDANPERTCAICLESFEVATFSTRRFSAACNHPPSTCYTCMAQHIQHQLDSRGVNLSANNPSTTGLTCPQCPGNLEHADVQEFAEPEVFARFDALMLRHAVAAAEPNFRWCMRPGCGDGQIHERGAEEPIVICHSCGARSCFTHEIPWHEDMTCKEYDGEANELYIDPYAETEAEGSRGKVGKKDAGWMSWIFTHSDEEGSSRGMKSVITQLENDRQLAEKLMEEDRKRHEKEMKESLKRWKAGMRAQEEQHQRDEEATRRFLEAERTHEENVKKEAERLRREEERQRREEEQRRKEEERKAKAERDAEERRKKDADAAAVRNRRKQEEDASKRTVENISKPCPGCKAPIQKNDGCDHMTCRKCRHEFCWLCMANYKAIRKSGNSQHRSTCRYYA